MQRGDKCPICRSESVHVKAVPNWGEMRRCVHCEFVFANPMVLPESPEAIFNKAYRGDSQYPGMEEYARRIPLMASRTNGHIDPRRTLFWGAYEVAMPWMKANVPRGSVVLDIGCGVGYFVKALRRNGFSPVGLDVARTVVDRLGKEGFDMWHGTVDSIPSDWNQPKVCTSFFVMHHLTDPVGFLATIRTKFPKATLLLAAWHHAPMPKKIVPANLPPRTLSWWGPKALQEAMKQAGYQVDLVSQPVAAGEFETPRIVRRLLWRNSRCSVPNGLLSTYYTVKPVLFWPWKVMRGSTERSSTIIAIGRPDKAATLVPYKVEQLSAAY